MNLLSNENFEDENVKIITNLLKKCFTNYQREQNFSFSKLLTFQEFKENIYNFITSIMHKFLDNYNFGSDKCTVMIIPLSKKNKGFFLNSEKYGNLIVINEEVIRNIYDGHIEDFIVIFHELNHFKIKYDIESGIINEDTVRIIKEKLIRTSEDRYSFNPQDSNYYYCDNYEVYSEEIYANLQAKKDFLLMLKSLTDNKLIQEEFSSIFEEEYKDEMANEKKRYNNHIRDLSSRSDFNDYSLSFEDAFDLLVTDNPKWLKYPQISIEYYIDENNKIQKRSIRQLQEQLNSSNNHDKIKYINYLINRAQNTESLKK